MNSRPSGGSTGQARRVHVVAALATTGGTGCTSVVANLAWVLASAGRQVLVVDWGSEAPHVLEYLESFHIGDMAIPDDLGTAVLAAYGPVQGLDRAPRLVAERFLVPEASGHIDVITTMEADGAVATDRRVGDPRSMADLRAQLIRSGYDNVLIDAPTGLADDTVTLIATVCDLAAVCFRPRPRAISDTADLAKRLRRQASVWIDLLPVATMFDDEHEPRAAKIRSMIRTAFAEVLADESQSPRMRDIGSVEIPYRNHDAFDPLLALLVEDPDSGGALEAQYGRLADAVTAGAVRSPAPVSPELRARYGRAFGLESPVGQDRVLIAYAAPDRPWADWVADQLRRAGAQPATLPAARSWLNSVHPPGIVVIATPHFAGSPDEAVVSEAVATAEAAGRLPKVIELPVTGDQETGPAGSRAWDVDAEHAEQRLRTTLFNGLGLIGLPSVEQDAGMRLPGRTPRVFRLPARRPLFVGRDDELERLRDRLTAAEDGLMVLTLGGRPGIGKSSLALEYAHRFANDYDVVWWIPADSRQPMLLGLAQLAGRLRPQGGAEYGTTSALAQLARNPGGGRFLLVYDNADDPGMLAGLLPDGGNGHVLITSNAADAPEIGLGAMSARDSTLLLTGRVTGMTLEDGSRVADAVRRLPLALELAAAWLAEAAAAERDAGAPVSGSGEWAVRGFLERLDGRPTESDRQLVARVVGLVTETLREKDIGRLAVLLAQLCSFLSPQGAGLGLIRSPAMINRLAEEGGADADGLRLDHGELDRALWIGARYGLFRVDWGDQRALVVHRIVRAALREAMSEDELRRRRTAVLHALAAFAPTEVENREPYYESRFAELQNHVFPSGAVESDDDAVRRWLVNQVRFLYASGGSGVRRDAIGPATELLAAWTRRYGATDPLRCRLAAHLANIHRVLGAPAEALRLDDSALGQQRRSFPLTHPQPLLSAMGRGGDLRALGLFAEALEEDQATWAGFRRELGEDHEYTRMAANNLAVSMFLSGDVRDALATERDNFGQRMRLFGPGDPRTWWSLARIGLYRCELGEYQEAWDALLTTAQRLRPPETGDNRRAELSVRWYQAIVLRRRGDGPAAEDRTRSVRREYRRLEGEDHPYTLACTLSLAAAKRMVGDDPALTVELARTALDGHRERVGLIDEHPFVALCRVGLGLALYAAGELGEAVNQLDAGRDTLRERLGEVHPWTLAAEVDLARVTYSGNVAAVRAAYEDCARFLGATHPHTVIAEGNLEAACAGGDGHLGWREIDVDIPQT